MNTEHPFLNMRSGVEHMVWPPFAAGPGATLSALLQQFELSQWLPYDVIVKKQFEQLVTLAEYANRFSPHFRSRLQAAGLKPSDLSTPEQLRRLPPLTRRDIQKAGPSLHCSDVPRSHMPMSELRTSGSTGEPVVVRKTSLNNVFWMAITMREHFWHRRDFSGRLFIIRANIPKPVDQQDWGPPVSLLYKSAPMRVISATTDIREQLAQIREFRPEHLLAYPSNLAGLMNLCEKENAAIEGLKHIWSIGETLPPDIRQRAENFFGAAIEDNYSSQEMGIITLQCPVSGLHHVMSESVIVEIVDDNGNPCEEGQIGRVLVTDLHNFATPLLRYELGDCAEAGGTCPCGRQLPVIREIKGRIRNLIAKPDGSRHWLGFQKFRDIPELSQFQFIQHSLERIEVRLVTKTPPDAALENRLRPQIQAALGHPFDLEFVHFPDRLPQGANGKFEEFICKV